MILRQPPLRTPLHIPLACKQKHVFLARGATCQRNLFFICTAWLARNGTCRLADPPLNPRRTGVQAFAPAALGKVTARPLSFCNFKPHDWAALGPGCLPARILDAEACHDVAAAQT